MFIATAPTITGLSNLIKRIERPKDVLAWYIPVHESHKENWKWLLYLTLSYTMPWTESHKENWKKYNVYLFFCPTHGESHKENWKITKRIYSFHNRLSNLIKRIERKEVEWERNKFYTESHKENWKCFWKCYTKYFIINESHKENWKISIKGYGINNFT